jgi:hypothetical protein
VLVFVIINTFHFGRGAAAFIFGFKPGLNNFLPSSGPITRAPRVIICALLLLRARSAEKVSWHWAARPRDFIGHNAHPNAGAANQDAAIVFALFNRHRHRMGNIRIDRTALAFIAAVIRDVNSQPIQISDDSVAKSIGGIIRTNSDCFHDNFLNLTVRLNDNSGKTKFGRQAE